MPELPEAETIARALRGALIGRAITRVEVFSPRMRNDLTPLRADGLTGSVFTDVRRRGRYVIAELDSSEAFLIHFGMSGVARIESGDVPRRKHEHIFIHLSDGEIFKFECTRRFSIFARVRLAQPGCWPEELPKMGPEPLDEAFDANYLFAMAKGRNVPVKSLIMDNAVVPGVGNIYAAESLFAGAVAPTRLASSLRRSECARITEAIKSVLTRAIEAGGSSISDYRKPDGSEGSFARRLAIYGRAGEACFRCGGTIARIRQAGRSSYFCPGCQK